MKLTIEGSAQDIQKVLQAMAGGKEHNVNISIDQLSKAVLNQIGDRFAKVYGELPN